MAKKRKTKPILCVLAGLKGGDRVRVKRGIRDDDYPDMPLGGWAGTITEVHEDGMVAVRWSRETLTAIHPVYEKRCDRDGTRAEEYWIEEKDLEPDQGGPLDIEQPTEIATRPLSYDDQDDRIRMVFGLTSNDPLPQVEEETLRTYYGYLLEHLVFPFGAILCIFPSGNEMIEWGDDIPPSKLGIVV